jgi:hypothetical protein
MSEEILAHVEAIAPSEKAESIIQQQKQMYSLVLTPVSLL